MDNRKSSGDITFINGAVVTVFSLFDLAAILLTFSAFFGWLNRRFLPLPHSIGVLLMSVLVSLGLIALDAAVPRFNLFRPFSRALEQIDFSSIVMNGMLAFLLFAGALHVNVTDLRRRAAPIILLATLGTIISTALVGVLFWCAALWIGYPVTLTWALVFGALISPTDPVAVLSTLRNVAIPANLKIEMQGEALFNDGIGIVLFTILLRFAVQGSSEETTAVAIVELLLLEAAGGVMLGLATGYIAYRSMREIDDYPVEVLISLALVTATYAIAQAVHVSGPLSMVACGLLIGNRGPRDAMSDRTQQYLFGLWTLIDEILNSVLFLLIGLESIVLRFDARAMLLAGLGIPAVLLGRFIAVAIPPIVFAWTKLMSLSNVPFLTWAGVRGGISVALALSVPGSPAKPGILAATYSVVLFSIIVQGLTLGFVARRTISNEVLPSESPSRAPDRPHEM
jgi:CPA1 family monovalent cation:H+ antiporter